MSAKKPLPSLMPEEEARIQRSIANDPDNPELTDAEIASLKPFEEVFPALAESIKRARGRPKLDAPKEAVTLRLSPETIARFKAQSGSEWRTKMSEALEKSIK